MSLSNRVILNKRILNRVSSSKSVRKTCSFLLRASFVLCFYVAPALAGYRPPRTARLPQGPAIPGGRRGGCAMPANVNLTALSPQSHVGRTQSLQPTLAWFVPSEVSYELTLQLYEYGDNNWTKIDQRSLGQSRYGYMHYTLPSSLNLSTGNLYRWHIVLACDPSRPSASQVASAQFEIVPAQVSSATLENNLQLAEQYSDVGLWYDAIAALSSQSDSSEVINRSEATAYLSQFLLDAALLDEANTSPPVLSTPSPLRQIASLLTEER